MLFWRHGWFTNMTVLRNRTTALADCERYEHELGRVAREGALVPHTLACASYPSRVCEAPRQWRDVLGKALWLAQVSTVVLVNSQPHITVLRSGQDSYCSGKVCMWSEIIGMIAKTSSA